jgi:hypothetical protein
VRDRALSRAALGLEKEWKVEREQKPRPSRD